MTEVNYEKHADALAEVLQEFVFIHSGSDNGIGLQLAFQDALKALLAYRQESEPAKEKPLKDVLKETYWRCRDLQGDPWEEVLLALAEQAHRWTRYASDDRETTQDIIAWLTAEAKA